MKTRRQFLRAAGVCVGLPYLESLGGAARRSENSRYAFIYTPNGYQQRSILPEQLVPGLSPLELTPTLEPLTSVVDDIVLMSGLDRQFVPGTSVHAQCGSCWLTSSAPQETLDGGFPTNITLDQLIAQQVTGDCVLPSLELSANDFIDSKETKYFECVSWYGPGFAATTEKNPRAVFRRLFGQAKGGASLSVLDTIMADAKSLQSQLGGGDRNKMEEYLASVRATEMRIQKAESAARRIGRTSMPEPIGIPERRGEYLRIMADLIIHAFEHDLTRVATLVIDPERWDSPRMYHGVFDKPQNHHVLTHTKGADAAAKLALIDRFHFEFYGYFVERLKAAGLLENTTLVMGSGISDGDDHRYTDLEVMIAGGRWRKGHYHYAGQRPLADLWLTMAQNSGVKLDRFADSTGPIKELL